MLFSEIEFSLGMLYCVALVSMSVCNFCLKRYHSTNSVPHEQVNEDVDFCFVFVFSILMFMHS